MSDAEFKLPAFHLSKLEQRRDTLFDRVFVNHAGYIFNYGTLISSVSSIREIYPQLSEDALSESLRLLADTTPTRKELFVLSWRMAANFDRLVANKPMLPPDSFAPGDWVLCQVTRATFTHIKEKPAAEYELFFLTGAVSCRVATRTLSLPASRVIASRVGFSAPWGNYPFTHYSQLVGLRMAVQLAKPRYGDDFVSLAELTASPAIAKWNRDNILDLRFRLKGKKCQFEYRHACHKCAIGYTVCLAATHKSSYEVGYCGGCNDENAVFDVDTSDQVCMDCAKRATPLKLPTG